MMLSIEGEIMKTSQPFDPESIPWIPLGPGESFKPLHFSERGRALLLRLESGAIVPLHRHFGEVHAFNLSGSRRLIETDEIVGPGGYVYEPAGNVDSWMAVGDEPVVVHIVSFGAMEYIGADGEVTRRDTPSSLYETYIRFCTENNLTPAVLR
jgi:2,4'-dihydroxyacetophenone dioxygenase